MPSETGLLFTKKITKEDFYNAPIHKKAFFQNKLKLTAPLQGEIHVKPNQKIEFILENVSKNMKLHYAFIENKTPLEINPSCVNSTCTFNIQVTQKNNTELFIFVNRQIILQYKVLIEK